MTVDNSPVVLRVGMDGGVMRVPFECVEGGAGALFREQIGCSLYDVISLDGRTDMWVDDEAIVGVDFGDREALAEAVNMVASAIARRFGRRQPVFGMVVIAGLAGGAAAALDVEQLARLEHLAELSAAVFGEALAARAGGSPVMRLTIKVENAYSDGHESERVETVEVVAFDGLEELWERLAELCGDGHGVGNDLGYCHRVTVLDAPDRPGLVGLSNEWVGA